MACTAATSTACTVHTVGRSAAGSVRSFVKSAKYAVLAENGSAGSARTRRSSVCHKARQQIATTKDAKPGSPHFCGFP
jgi:hypothetical protein